MLNIEHAIILISINEFCQEYFCEYLGDQETMVRVVNQRSRWGLGCPDLFETDQMMDLQVELEQW